MTVKKAIKLCNVLIKKHRQKASNLRLMMIDSRSPNLALGIISFAEEHEDIAKCIFAIEKNLQTKCKHPKRMRDKAGGQVYCMNCNSDLDD